MKILNLYACLGGNRYKWDEVYPGLEITAVELDPVLAELYQERFPNDNVIVADAHQYLLENFQNFDFIWSSPPCPTHSSVRVSQKNTKNFVHKYPDMKLYQEIIFLQNFYKGLWVIENVIPYYQPLIPAQKRGRHLYWANFRLPMKLGERKSPGIGTTTGEVGKLTKFHAYDFRKYNGNQRIDKIARNLVDYEVGKSILGAALKIKTHKDKKQALLF